MSLSAGGAATTHTILMLLGSAPRPTMSARTCRWDVHQGQMEGQKASAAKAWWMQAGELHSVVILQGYAAVC